MPASSAKKRSDPGGFVAGVPEGVPLVARLEDQVARPADQYLVAEQRADASFQDVAVLVLAGVPVPGLPRHRPPLAMATDLAARRGRTGAPGSWWARSAPEASS